MCLVISLLSGSKVFASVNKLCLSTFKMVFHHVKGVLGILKVLFQFWTFGVSGFKSNFSVRKGLVSIFGFSDSLVKGFFSVTCNAVCSLCLVEGFLSSFFSVKCFCKIVVSCCKNGFLETKACFSFFVSACSVCDRLLGTCDGYFGVFKFLCFCCKGCCSGCKRLVKGLTFTLDLVLVGVVFCLKFLNSVTRNNGCFNIVNKGFFWKTDDTFTVFKDSFTMTCVFGFKVQHFKVAVAHCTIISFNKMKNVLVLFVTFTLTLTIFCDLLSVSKGDVSFAIKKRFQVPKASEFVDVFRGPTKHQLVSVLLI